MLCNECSLIDIGDAFPPPCTDTTEVEPLFRKRDDWDTNLPVYSSLPVPHGKTCSEMQNSGAQGCGMCKNIFAQLIINATRSKCTPPADDAPIFRSITRTSYRVDRPAPHHSSYRVTHLSFAGLGSTTSSFEEFFSPTVQRASVELFVGSGQFARDVVRYVSSLTLKPGHILAENGDMEYVGVGAADDPTFVQKQMTLCRSTHHWCRTPQRKLPTRVLDIEPWPGSDYVRLVSAKGCDGDYAALSHCWGSSPSNKTTRASEALHARGIATSSLCKTFQDAIKVTKALGLRYLWIDALCIIQDDEDDWRLEAETMADVYANASVTLAATASSDGNGGLFHPRPPWNIDSALKWTRSGNLTSETIYWRDRNDRFLFSGDVLAAPLNQRGWVVQERILSNRIIHFAKSQLFWECQQITLSETNIPCGNTSAIAVKPATLLATGPLTQQAWDQGDMNVVWREIVEKYTDCQLTFPSDKLVAIAGIAKAWARACGDRYVCGLWQSTLPVDLFWMRDPGPGRIVESRASRLPFPTWSWASRASRVIWIGLDEEPVENMLKDLQVRINGSHTKSFFTRAQEGVLHMTGYMKDAILQRVTPSMPLLPIGSSGPKGIVDVERDHWERSTEGSWYKLYEMIRRADGTNIGAASGGYQVLNFDHDDFALVDEPVPTVLLFRTTRQLSRYGHGVRNTDYVMFLQRLQEQDHYQRIGLGVIRWFSGPDSVEMSGATSWFNDANIRSIRIS